jgi:DNA-directed RNA polymerase specialized sigma24 family protein
MPSPELNPDWVLSNNSPNNKLQPLHRDDELIAVAGRLWPRVQAHARSERANLNSDESVALASEVWESVLQSVSKTLERRAGRGSEIVDLEAYLFGAFHHRFNRALKKERRRQQTIELVPLSRDLEQLPGARDLKSARDLELSIQVKEVIQNMDDWTRRAWAAKVYGYTWKEIAEHMGLKEHQAKLRFGHALRKLAARLGYGK